MERLVVTAELLTHFVLESQLVSKIHGDEEKPFCGAQ